MCPKREDVWGPKLARSLTECPYGVQEFTVWRKDADVPVARIGNIRVAVSANLRTDRHGEVPPLFISDFHDFNKMQRVLQSKTVEQMICLWIAGTSCCQCKCYEPGDNR